MTDEDRAVAAERRRGRGDGRDGSPYRLRLVAHDRDAYDRVLQRRREPDAVVHPALPVGPRGRAGRRPRAPRRVVRRLRAGQPRVRGRRRRRARTRARRRGLLPRLPPVPRAAARARGAPGGAARALRPHPVAQRDYWHVLPARAPRRASTTGCSRTTSSASTPSAGARNFLRSARTSSARRRLAATASCTRARTHVTRIRSRSTRRSSTSSRESAAVLEQERRSRRAARVARSSASTAPIRRRTSSAASAPSSSSSTQHPELHRRVVDARAARPVAAGRFPSTPSTSRRSSARRARSTTASSDDGWTPIDLQVADNFPQSVAAYKQYDVLLVNAVFDGLNLVAKEAPLVNDARRRARSCPRTPARTRSSAMGADGQSVRRPRPGRRDPRRR